MLQKEKNTNQDDKKNKKNLFNPFLNDKEYYSVDEKLPVQIKSKIPHWVPNKNSDIFEVRKVMVSEKEQTRNINRSLGVYKQDNKILISKNILEEEAKKGNQKIRNNLSLKIMKEEKIKKDFYKEKYFVKKQNYNFINSIKINKNGNNIEPITESDLEENDFYYKNKEKEFNLNTSDKIDFRKEKAMNINSRMNSVDFVNLNMKQVHTKNIGIINAILLNKNNKIVKKFKIRN